MSKFKKFLSPETDFSPSNCLCASLGKPDLKGPPSFFPCLQNWVLEVSLLDNKIGEIIDILNFTPTSDSVIFLYIPLVSGFQNGFIRHMHQNYLGYLLNLHNSRLTSDLQIRTSTFFNFLDLVRHSKFWGNWEGSALEILH